MKKSQLDRAVDALTQRKGDILAKCNAECEAIDASIRVIAAQQARKPKKRAPLVNFAGDAVPA
jgi:hypothetical protein